MLVYILITEDGYIAAVYSDEKIANIVQPQVDAKIGKPTKIVRRKVDLPVIYLGKEDHHQ